MAKPLSQEEIDVLLSVRSEVDETESHDSDSFQSVMSREADERILPYNFKRPRLFSQDQMRALNYVHETFARDLSVYLSAQLRTIVDIRLTAIDQVLYSEYVMSSAPPAAIYVVEVENEEEETKRLGRKAIFEVDPRLVIYTIEKLFGGPGVFLKKPRDVSQIEQRIMGKVMERAFRELEKAWQQVHTIKLEQVAFETNAEFVQIIPGVEPALVSTFEVAIYDQRSFINLCYPYILLERMLGRAGVRQWISGATTPVPDDVRHEYESTVRSTTVELCAELGRARLPVDELLQLEVGDVIPLNRRTKDPVQVYVDQIEKFKAVAGRAGRYRAVRVQEVLTPPPSLVEDSFSAQQAQQSTLENDDPQSHREAAPDRTGVGQLVSEDAAQRGSAPRDRHASADPA